jgi:hypothetical protein
MPNQKWFELKVISLMEKCQTWHKGLFKKDTLNKLKFSNLIK